MRSKKELETLLILQIRIDRRKKMPDPVGHKQKEDLEKQYEIITFINISQYYIVAKVDEAVLQRE